MQLSREDEERRELLIQILKVSKLSKIKKKVEEVKMPRLKDS